METLKGLSSSSFADISMTYGYFSLYSDKIWENTYFYITAIVDDLEND